MSSKKTLFLQITLILLLLLPTLTACGNGQSKAEDFIVSVQMPQRGLSQGQNFVLTLTLQNNSIKNKEVKSIILPAAFIKGVNAFNTQPAMPRGINSNGDWVFEYERTIAPQGLERVAFYFETAPTGHFEAKGVVNTSERSYEFALGLTVLGVNPADWSPGAAKPISDEAVYEPPYLSVVKIDAFAEQDGQRTQVWSGNGAIISSDGLILTSADVVLSDRFFQLTDLLVSLTVDAEAPPVPSYRASIVQADAKLGLAIIKPRETLDGKAIDYSLLDLPVLALGDSRVLEQDAELRVTGYPQVPNTSELMSERNLRLNDFGAEFPFGEGSLWHVDRAIEAGYLGAPVLNEAGELVAVPIHKSPITFDPRTVTCEPVVDDNRDGRIDALDPCPRTSLPIDTLRPIHLAQEMIDAARRGEISISMAGIAQPLSHTPVKLIDTDDFSNNRNQWKITGNDFGEQKIEDGDYLFKVHKPMTQLWSSVGYGYDQPMQIDVEARVTAPVYNGEFGVICGLTETERTVFSVSENGYFAIWKVQNDAMHYLQDWRYGGFDAEQTLNLSVQCGQGWYQFAVNERVLAQGTDPDFTSGLTGLYVASYDKGGLTVHFDNFSVSIIE